MARAGSGRLHRTSWKQWARGARNALKGATTSFDVARAVVLDETRLWVTADAPRAGGIVALSTADGVATGFSSRLSDGCASVVVDLTELPGTAAEEFSLYFESARRRLPLRLTSSVDTPAVAPQPGEGPWYSCVVARDRSLSVRRRPRRAGRLVRGLGAGPDGVVIAWVAEPDDEFALVGPGKHVVPVEPDYMEPGRVYLPVTAFPDVDRRASVMVRAGGRFVPLVRAGNDLARPNGAVVLPEVESNAGVMRLAWRNDGVLRVVWRHAR